MKAIQVMFDSLNRHLLAPYGCAWTHTPNFARLAERTVTFDKFHIGSMPCMPARRELHTGRSNFLHRSWGPLEPFDDSMPEILHRRGVWTHLVSDHYHYWEDGGATYHNRYSSWDAVRGQEGDQWHADVAVKTAPPDFNPAPWSKIGPHHLQDYINRRFIHGEADMPQRNTFKGGLEFIEKNHDQDNWFLHIETFDPHEPFFTQPEYKKNYQYNYDALGVVLDWPAYRATVPGEEKQIEHFRMQYAALLTMCDHYLGTILDAMDRFDLWKDTMLIVNTDHGFLLGEHGWLAKNHPPLYAEIANTPFFMWDPRSGRRGVRNKALTQTIDIAPTLLEYFGAPIPADMTGKSLAATVADGSPVHDEIIFGYFGQHCNVTDGRYVYMRAPNQEKTQFEYTLMPTRMRGFFNPAELARAELHDGFSFTKGAKLLKIPAGRRALSHGDLLLDREAPGGETASLNDPDIAARMLSLMRTCMEREDAPPELYERLLGV